MGLTSRDKLLVLVLPAVLILAIYGWSVPGKHLQLASAADALATVRAQAPSPEMLQGWESRVARLTRDTVTLQRDIGSLKRRWEEAAAKCASAELRNERIKKLTTLLRQNRLTVLDDAEVEGGKGKLPKAMEQLVEQFVQVDAGLRPQTRQLHLFGAYLDVQQVIRELSQGEVLAIPVGLSMKPSPAATTLHEWTLLVWI
jgi:hypothetical protein